MMRSIWCSIVAAVALTATLPLAAVPAKQPARGTDTMHIKTPVRPLVLVDQVGYNPSGPKRAIVQGFEGDRFTSFEVVGAHDGKVVLRGTPKPVGGADHWKRWRYWTVDFSAVRVPGWYRVKVGGSAEITSFPFRIVDHVLQRYTLSNVIYYFKGQRVSGALHQADAHLKNPLPNGPLHVDLHGGWYAATGDYSVHLTEGNDDTAFIYQEVPLVAWNMVATWRNLMATLAAASMLPQHGHFSNARYLQVAEDAFAYLRKHSASMLNGKHPNIVDDYCALLAATELYRATRDQTYRQAADTWADRLMAQQATQGKYRGHWRAGTGSEPFFNETDQGLPIVALAHYARITTPARKDKIRDVVRRSLQFDLRITEEVNNPFGYARQLVREGDGATHTAFFMPHNVKGIAPWWQGEDARLASMAATARIAAPMFAGDPAFQSRLQQYTWDQLHWILGRNPYDTSMLMSSGYRNAEYTFIKTWQFTSAPGAIVNGITAGQGGEDGGIAFNPETAKTGRDDDWRWYEQWLPHAAWYLYAVSLPHGH